MPSGRNPDDEGSGRRKFLKATGTAAVAATLAGCSEPDEPTETDPAQTDTDTDTETSTPTGSGSEAFDYNFTGYGAGDTGNDEAIAAAYGTVDTAEASEKFARTMERIYMDSPYRVYYYRKMQWPFNSADWEGAVDGLVDPAYASWFTEANNIKQAGGDSGGTFTYGMATKPDSANVTQASSVYSAVALYLCYQGPIMTDSEDTPQPWLYTDWELRNTDAEYADAYFNMRDDVKFGDGSDVTAEDIIFTYDYIVRNEISEYASATDNLKDLGVPEDAEGTATPAEGSHVIEEADEEGWDFHAKVAPVVAWPINTIGAVDILPKAVWEGTDPQTFDPMANDEAFGIGPGQLTQYNADTSMRVEMVNDSYSETLNNQQWVQDDPNREAGGPFVDAVNFQIFGSDSAMTQAFLQGDIDCHYGSIDASSRQEVIDRDDRTLIEGPDSGFGYFGFNLTRKPIDDACFRQALNFCWDERFWVESLQDNAVFDGDYPQSPGYPAARPETYADGVEMLEAPETDLFGYRRVEEGSPRLDIEAVRGFLTDGQVASGDGGTYAGQEWPGTVFDDISASQSEAKHEYTLGEVQSEILQERSATEQELYVDGQTIPEAMDGGPIEIITDPPANSPRQAKAMNNWVQNLRSVGIPAKTRVLSFNTLEAEVFFQQDFDITELGWGGTSPYGASNYFFFHSNFYTA